MKRYREIIDTIPMFFLIWDIKKKKTTFINKSFYSERINGYFQPEHPREDLRQYISEESRKTYDNFFASLSKANNYTGHVELKASSDLPNINWLSLETYPVEEEGEVKRVVGHIRDTTRQREGYELLHEQVKSLDVVAFMLAHELSAPVSNIMGLADLLKQKVMEPDREAYLHLFDKIYSFGGEILTLARGLVGLIDLQETRSETIEKNTLPLKSFLENSLQDFYFRHEQTTISLADEVRDETLITLDEQKFKWAMNELLLYMTKICRSKSNIYITEASEDASQKIFIYAENIELPRDNIRQVLCLSIRLELSNVWGKKISGMLELIIANEIVRLHEGMLTFYDDQDRQGFVISLPKATA